MKKPFAAALVALGVITVPATASATQYWGGPMGGGDLPVANITYKVNEGKVRHVLVNVRVKCRAQGGGPHPNAQLVMGWDHVKKTSSGFKAKRRRMLTKAARGSSATRAPLNRRDPFERDT